MHDTYTITMYSWQSWLFLFFTAVFCMLIGYYICRKNFYTQFMESYARSKGKSRVVLGYMTLARLKMIFEMNGSLVITGGTVADRQGLLELVKSYNEYNKYMITYEQIKLNTLPSVLGVNDGIKIATCEDYNTERDFFAANVLVIKQGKKISAVMYVLNSNSHVPAYETVEEYFRRVSDEK